jgi:hypothetical protein
MKNKWLMILVILMTGCSTVTAMLLKTYPFDPVEYSLAVDLTVNTTRAIHRCENTTASNTDLWKFIQNVNTADLELQEYSSNKDNSEQLMVQINQIAGMISNILSRSTFTPQYCIHKLGNIQAASRILDRTLGRNEKFNPCQGGIIARSNAFTASYKANKITVNEYKELVMDLAKLKEIDTTGCSTANRNKMQDELNIVNEAIPVIMGL